MAKPCRLFFALSTVDNTAIIFSFKKNYFSRNGFSLWSLGTLYILFPALIANLCKSLLTLLSFSEIIWAIIFAICSYIYIVFALEHTCPLCHFDRQNHVKCVLNSNVKNLKTGLCWLYRCKAGKAN